MQIIIATTIVITLIGIVVGAGLVFTGKKFYVEVDERETAVREALPGNNCGACGYAGCDALAGAIVTGDASVNACPVGGAACADAIALIMGVDAGDAAEKQVAFVRCKGTCDVTKNQGNYIGLNDCRSAALSGMNISDCAYGCLGLGSCVTVCPTGAISVQDGVAVVDPQACISCGLCAKACPKHLIEMRPLKKTVAVQCMNKDRGPQVKAVCSAGCIGCMICEKQCQFDAIHVADNLAQVNYENCTLCGACVTKCPVKVISNTGGVPKISAAPPPCGRSASFHLSAKDRPAAHRPHPGDTTSPP